MGLSPLTRIVTNLERHLLSLSNRDFAARSLPARTFQLKDRGLVREGLAADLVVMDFPNVRDRATFDKPHQFSEGFDFVIVNGELMVENGALTDARAGRVVRGAAFARSR